MARPAFLRKYLKKDVIYNFIRFRDVYISVSKKLQAANRVRDDLILEMEKEGLISSDERRTYEGTLLAAFSRIECYDEAAPWEIYGEISRLRLAAFGKERLAAMAALQASRGVDFAPAIDQSHIKDRLIREAATITVVLSEPALRAQLEADLAKAEGKRICSSDSLPEAPEGLVLYYGESGLLECGGLSVPAVVTAIPRGYCAQAVTGLWDGEGCVVYIPAGFDIAPHVPMTSKTRLTYSHLALLEKRFGEEIYGLSVTELYRRWPRFFGNIYGLAESRLPVAPTADSLTEFDRRLEEDLGAFLGGFPGAAYTAAYFDEGLQRRAICYDAASNQTGILVHGIRVKKAAGAKVLQCEKGQTPRAMFRQLGLPGTALVSNFLFFMTPKLGNLYNDLRADRPYEQADAASGHLDYMLSYRDGKRIETFPLFGKTCIGMRENGAFLFFNFFLGGGCVDISGIRYRWEKEDVNSERSLRVYTPMYSAADRAADRDTYRKAVGEGRVNVVLLREKVTCIRRGDVLLPSVGVVLSLTERAAAPLLEKCRPLEDGYYDVSDLELTVRLDAPEGVEDWESVRWAYGGGLTLIRNGEGLCDGEHMEQWFETEGWNSPLSRQTQESRLHVLAKHPRTAIGCAENGDLLVLVYSGRTWRSTGADYNEMIRIARQLFPDVYYLMNGDGGGSAMLGLVHEGEFLELSCPSTSFGSCAGQVRPINTVFYIPLEG